MPKEYFKVEETVSLSAVPKGGAIHIIGVCGVAMAQIAVLLAKKGYAVSGSDKEFYEPMGSLLKNSPVKTLTGYQASNVPEKADLVVIGNAISYGNPEVSVVEEQKLPYTCFPKILDETVIAGRHSITVTGTHGKSTTSAMIAAMLNKMSLDPSYFVGGIAEDLPNSLHAGEGKFAVLEGDEYDSAFFAKVPKFAFYHPDTCIVNAVEFDHADIYPDLAAINNEFTKLILSLKPDATAICCIDMLNVRELVQSWKRKANCKFITFGTHSAGDYRIESRRQEGLKQFVNCEKSSGEKFSFEIGVPGEYNAKNALAALITAEVNGLDRSKAAAALAAFTRVKRRQEVRFESPQVLLIEDFAHHPTAVYETINAVKEAFPKRRLWAVFEPRSNTSRRKVFQDDYIRAFNKADKAILCDVAARSADEGLELINVATLSKEISKSGVSSECLPDAKAIEEYLFKQISNNDLVLVMSNGSFGGLIQSLEDGFRKKFG